MKRLFCLLLLMFAAPLAAQDTMPPAPYAYRQLDDPAQEAKAQALMETLRCLKCQSQSIADSDAPMAGDMRSQVRQRIAAGEEPEAIRAWLVERYGDYVSYAPRVTSLTWPLFVIPVVLLALAALLLRRRFIGGGQQVSWVWALLLAGLSLGLIMFLMRRAGTPLGGWEAVAAALLLGIAGYGLQGSPGLPGAPRQATGAASAGDPQAIVAERKALDGQPGNAGSNWVVIADAFARQGQYADAAGVLLGAVDKNPGDADAWLALANALVGHADGTLSPAALYAYRQAAQAAPDHPGPPLFLGLAMAQSGRFMEARSLWGDLLARTPADAPWRTDLIDRLGRLDALIARAQGQMTAPDQSGDQSGTTP